MSAIPETRNAATPSTPAAPSPSTETASPEAASPETGSQRLISGIDLVDFGAGGLYPEKVYVVKGEGGTGKTILGLQFLTRGLELNENGVLITDQKPEDLMIQARTIGFPLEEPVRRGQLLILNPSHSYFELVESPADVMAIIEELGDFVRKMDARRLVIDPFSTLVNTNYSGHFATSVTQSILNSLDQLPVTTLVIAGQNAPELAPVLSALEQNAFGVIDLSADEKTGGRMMRLSRLRFASNDKLSAPYRILNGRGLINYEGGDETVQDVTKPWENGSEANRSVLLLGAPSDTIRKVQEALGDGVSVSAENDFEKGLERVRKEKPGLVLVTPSRAQSAVKHILDLAQSSSSVAFLSPSSNRSTDKVLYLRAGADDFITEPFSAPELRARVDALLRRSGRRLTQRDQSASLLTADDIRRLDVDSERKPRPRRPVLSMDGSIAKFDPEFEDKLSRNLDTMTRLDTDFALYWLKSKKDDPELNKTLARLCRQEDVLCHNSNGEFVAILTGTDENGLKGFEARLQDKIEGFGTDVQRGWSFYRPGDSATGIADRSLHAR